MRPSERPATTASNPARRSRNVRDRDQHALATREEIAGDPGEALAAAILDDARRESRRGGRSERRAKRRQAPPELPRRRHARRAALQLVPEGRVLAKLV